VLPFSLPTSPLQLTGKVCWQTDPLGEYRWLDIGGPIARVADTLWIYGGGANKTSDQLLVPHWKACLAVVRQWGAEKTQLSDARLSILGPVVTPRRNDIPKGSEVIAVRLHPEAVAAILGVEPMAIANRDLAIEPTAALDDVLRLAESGAAAEFVGAALLVYLGRLLDVVDKMDPLSAAAANLLRRSSGRARTRVVAEMLETSERTLRRRFQQHIGMSPKKYARQTRLKQLLLHMDREVKPNWTALAYEFGYFDQAHLIEDTRLLTGLGPTGLHAMRRRKVDQPQVKNELGHQRE
jgi:AraC-like DNA-binding protein